MSNERPTCYDEFVSVIDQQDIETGGWSKEQIALLHVLQEIEARLARIEADAL
jgi:hypothetical protein